MKQICQLDEIQDGQAKSFPLPDKPDRTFLIARKGDQAWGYLNMCPHMGVELEFSPDQFMSFDGSQLQCAMHGALFEVSTGFCNWGPCQGRSLIEIKIQIKQGVIFCCGESTTDEI